MCAPMSMVIGLVEATLASRAFTFVASYNSLPGARNLKMGPYVSNKSHIGNSRDEKYLYFRSLISTV